MIIDKILELADEITKLEVELKEAKRNIYVYSATEKATHEYSNQAKDIEASIERKMKLIDILTKRA